MQNQTEQAKSILWILYLLYLWKINDCKMNIPHLKFHLWYIPHISKYPFHLLNIPFSLSISLNIKLFPFHLFVYVSRQESIQHL